MRHPDPTDGLVSLLISSIKSIVQVNFIRGAYDLVRIRNQAGYPRFAILKVPMILVRMAHKIKLCKVIGCGNSLPCILILLSKVCIRSILKVVRPARGG